MQAYFDDFGKYGLVARHCNCIFGGFLIFKGVPKILKNHVSPAYIQRIDRSKIEKMSKNRRRSVDILTKKTSYFI